MTSLIQTANRAWVKALMIPAVIVLLALAGYRQLAALKQAPSQAAPTTEISTPVSTQLISAQPHMIPLEGFGTLQALDEVTLIPEVSGKIVEQHPKLALGLSVQTSEMLFRIDPSEYQYRLKIEEANLARAEFELKEEQGRGLVAQREWRLLDERLRSTGISKELALRQAHQAQKEAALEGATGSLALAKLNLERTRIKAPCDGVIIQESVSIGQWVAQGSQLATLACTDRLKLIVSMPPDHLAWRAGFNHPDARARVQGNEARFVRLLSEVDPNTRMIQLLFELPGALLNNTNTTPDNRSILLGQFTQLVFEVPSRTRLFSIPTDSIRDENQIWILKNDRLAIKDVEVLYRLSDTAMVQLKEPTHQISLITNYINTPYLGMPLTVNSRNTAP